MLSLLALLAAPLLPIQDASRPYKLLARVEDFTLTDLAGASRSVLREVEGKAILLVFWSQRDPVSRGYVPGLTELASKNADKLAVWLIDSNHDELVGGGADPLDTIRRYVKDERVTLPILLDRENRVADDFGATGNSQVFLLDADRVVRYVGGIDNDPRGELKKKSQPVQAWLADALEVVLAGGTPEHNWTRSAGRTIKRVPKPAAEPASSGSKG